MENESCKRSITINIFVLHTLVDRQVRMWRIIMRKYFGFKESKSIDWHLPHNHLNGCVLNAQITPSKEMRIIQIVMQILSLFWFSFYFCLVMRCTLHTIRTDYYSEKVNDLFIKIYSFLFFDRSVRTHLHKQPLLFADYGMISRVFDEIVPYPMPPCSIWIPPINYSK